MERQLFLDSLATLSDEDLEHLAAIVNDASKRLPESSFAIIGPIVRAELGIEEPAPEPEPIPFVPSPNDKSVQL
jgi:hypothetical protein